MLPSGKRQMAARRSTIFLHVCFKQRLFFLGGGICDWKRRKENLALYDVLMNADVMLFADVCLDGRRSVLFVRTYQRHHSFYIPAWVWKWIDWFIWKKRFSKVSQANVQNKNYHEKKKRKKIQSWHIFIKQMNNQSTLEECRILAGQFAHPTLNMQRQGTGWWYKQMMSLPRKYSFLKKKTTICSIKNKNYSFFTWSKYSIPFGGFSSSAYLPTIEKFKSYFWIFVLLIKY